MQLRLAAQQTVEFEDVAEIEYTPASGRRESSGQQGLLINPIQSRLNLKLKSDEQGILSFTGKAADEIWERFLVLLVGLCATDLEPKPEQ